MTSPYVTFPQPQPQSAPQPAPRSSAWPVLRALLAVLAVLAGILGYLIAAAVAIVEWTGCFIGCIDADHRAGALFGVLAVALLGAGPGAVAALYRSRVWLRVAISAAGLGAALLVLAFSSN